MRDYPEALRRAAAPLRRREKFARALLDILIKVIWIGYPIFSGFIYKSAMGQGYHMWLGLVHLLALYSVFVVGRLLIVDGLIFCLITPGFVVVDGTDDMKDVYKDFRFYTGKALSRFAESVLFSILVTGVLAI